MTVLFGFTGAPDPTLLGRMDAALRHRAAGGELRKHQAAELSVGVRAERGFLGRQAGGCLQQDDQGALLAAAGFAVSPEPGTDLLAAYRRRGPQFLHRLRGAFVLAVWDGRELDLIRDGAGARTLFYARHQGRVLFAVETKALTAAPGFDRRLRPASLAQYLSFSFVPGEHTMLEGVHELEAGQVVTIHGDRILGKRRWFCFEDAAERGDPHATSSQTDTDPEAEERCWVARTRACIADSVAERLPDGGEPVGITLSGGLDSSAITAEVAAQHRGPVHTYSLHFGRRYPSELDYARMVADRCGTQHHELLIRPKRMLSQLRRVLWLLDDPIGDPITAPNFELARRASADTRLLFNGEGGDPLLGGPKNLPMMLQHWYGMPRGPAFRERAYLASYRRAYEELTHLLSPDLLRQVDPERDLEGVLRPFFDAQPGRPFLHKLLTINTRLKGAHLILPKVERMTAAWGLTPHSPLFDTELIRLAFAMPPRMKLAAGIEKRVLKAAFTDRLPESVIRRPKSGMRVPVHFWFRGELRRYAHHLLSPRRIRREGIFDHRRIRRLLRYDADGGPGRYGIRLWMLLSFELWRRLTIEGEAI